ncbi:MAG: sugar phosphate isomerase/epimerase, partial [Clostridiales bacterium]|nr:sugar phosphate isomerase/epimerase [Clostridiales bacterium]
ANTHSQEVLDTFMRNLEDVVAEAERRGATVAIEPVWNHIVYNADRAVQVLKGIGSRNLRIILDPVNLLCLENIDDRDSVIADAIEKLGERVAMIHLKDFIVREGKLVSVAAGTGNMDYTRILRFMKERKPFIQATLENTDNTTAVPARRMLEELYDRL